MSLQTSCPADQGQHKFTAYHARRLRGFLAVPLSAIRDHGQAAGTLAGVLEAIRRDGRCTFRRQAELAKAAGVSVRQLHRHLAELETAGLVLMTREGPTNTYALGKSEPDLMAEGFLPFCRYAEGLPWTQRAVLAWITYRAEVSLDGATCEDSLAKIGKALGIDRRCVRRAVRALCDAGVLRHELTLAGEQGHLALVAPDTVPKTGSEKAVATPCQGEDKMAESLGTKWQKGGDKMATSSSKKRIKKHGPRRGMDQICVSVEEVTPTAGDLFRRCRYAGDRGGNLWKVAALLDAGLVSEHEAYDACQGCRECVPRDRPAYAVAILKTHVRRRGGCLVDLLRRVRIEPTWPTGPPAETAWWQ